MKRQKEIRWWILCPVIAVLFFYQLFTLYEVYKHEKFRFVNAFKASLMESAAQLNIRTAQPGYLAAYDPVTDQIYFIAGHPDSLLTASDNIHTDSLSRIATYDMRDPQQWNLDTLAEIFNSHNPAEHRSILPYRLSRVHANGSTIDQYDHNETGSKALDFTLTIPLSHLEDHLLKVEFTYPFALFFKAAGIRISLSILLFLLILYMVYLIHLQLKNEKKLRYDREMFTHSLVHNLRQPVLNIKCQLENLESDEKNPIDPATTEAVEHCRQWADKTLEDIADLLTLTVSAYGIKAQRTSTDIRKLLNQIAEEYRLPQSAEKRIDIQTEIHMPDPAIVEVDPLLLYGALGNLLENAIKYSGPEVSIRMICQQEGQQLQLIVKDNGFGIPEEEQKNIFKEYYRGERSNQDLKREGFGLGLYYVAAVVQAHQGGITVNSDGQHGTEFLMEIPQC